MHILILGLEWPEPQSTAAGSRMLQLITSFLEHDAIVHFASTSKQSLQYTSLKSKGVTEHFIELNDVSFDEWLMKLNPNIVLFDRFITEEYFGWRVKEIIPNALRILDTEDIHGLREARKLAHEYQAAEETFYNNVILKREIASILRCDLTLVISEVEMIWLRKYFNIAEDLLFYLPFMIQEAHFPKNLQPFSSRNHFCFVGSFMHKPNIDALKIIDEHIWPSIQKQIPKVEFHIYGSYSGHSKLNFKSKNILIKPYTNNIVQALGNYKLQIAYLPYGAGLKGKLIDAMLAGTPSIMNHYAAEGMFKTDSSGVITDSFEDIISTSVELFTNSEKWNHVHNMCHSILHQRFNYKCFSTAFITKIHTIISQLKKHRISNPIIDMMHHHTLQSSKYLSKWIEEKNKK